MKYVTKSHSGKVKRSIMQEEKGFISKAEPAGPLAPGMFCPALVWPRPSSGLDNLFLVTSNTSLSSLTAFPYPLYTNSWSEISPLWFVQWRQQFSCAHGGTVSLHFFIWISMKLWFAFWALVRPAAGSCGAPPAACEGHGWATARWCTWGSKDWPRLLLDTTNKPRHSCSANKFSTITISGRRPQYYAWTGYDATYLLIIWIMCLFFFFSSCCFNSNTSE